MSSNRVRIGEVEVEGPGDYPMKELAALALSLFNQTASRIPPSGVGLGFVNAERPIEPTATRMPSGLPLDGSPWTPPENRS